MASIEDLEGTSAAGVLSDAQFALLEEQLDAHAQAVTSLEGRVAKNASVAAVIVAGGQGERFGNAGGKQLFRILDKPILTWSAEAYDAIPEVGHIVIVCPEDRQEQYCAEAIDPYPFATPITFAAAGSIRQESAMNGVEAVDRKFEYIAVHDGARPVIDSSIVTRAIGMLKGNVEADGVVVGHPSIDTLKVVDDKSIVGTPDRNMFWVAQTPQIFRSDILRRAYSTAMFEGFVGTDDSSLVERMGGVVLMVNGPRDNLKVTVPEDVGPVTAALMSRLEARGE